MLSARLVPTALGPVELAEHGAGPVVLAVHGSPGDWRQCRVLTEALPGHRLLLASRPGYGATPLRGDRTPERQAARLLALLDALGIDRAVVLGVSGGGPAALALAAAHPERCDGLVLVSAVSPGVDIPSLRRSLAVRLALAVPGVHRAALRRERRALERTLARDGASAVDLGLTPGERARLADPAAARWLEHFAHDRVEALRGVAGFRADHRAFRRAIVAATAEGLTVPTLGLPVAVVHGDADEVVPLSHAQRSGEIAGVTPELVAGGGHAILVTHRDRLAAAVYRVRSSSSSSSSSF